MQSIWPRGPGPMGTRIDSSGFPTNMPSSVKRQTRTILSKPALHNSRPLGCHAREVTKLECPPVSIRRMGSGESSRARALTVTARDNAMNAIHRAFVTLTVIIAIIIVVRVAMNSSWVLYYAEHTGLPTTRMSNSSNMDTMYRTKSRFHDCFEVVLHYEVDV